MKTSLALLCLVALCGMTEGTEERSVEVAKRFTLVCDTSYKRPVPPITNYVIDVNLNLSSYYVDTQFGGLDEIDSADSEKIVFRKHRTDMHGLRRFTWQEYYRADGHVYWDVPRSKRKPGTLPDAICSLAPARENFMADSKYHAPNP
jgi:hypothetical protein